MDLVYKKFKEVDLNDVFFDSLKKGYVEFSDWFNRKAEEYAYVFHSDSGAVDGFLYLKIEDGVVNDVSPPLPSARRIKVGTMKINPHGTKLGERFVKKIFDYAIYHKISEIYVTVFQEHEPLIRILQTYGFSHVANKTTKNGTELVLIKSIFSPFTSPIKSYPLIGLYNQKAYVLSLHPNWHTRLLPDSILNNEDADIIQDISSANSIHKVYLASMNGLEVLRPGDALVIYRTSDGKGPAHYRSVATSIGVVEEYKNIHSFSDWDEFYRYCRPYSVFSRSELEKFWQEKKYFHVFKFSYNLAFKKRVTRGTMIEDIGISADQYWGFFPISHQQFKAIASRGEIDESLIVG